MAEFVKCRLAGEAQRENDGRLRRFCNAFTSKGGYKGEIEVTKSDCAACPVPDLVAACEETSRINECEDDGTFRQSTEAQEKAKAALAKVRGLKGEG